jgi:ABC-type sugar transport system substrate-binding protein
MLVRSRIREVASVVAVVVVVLLVSGCGSSGSAAGGTGSVAASPATASSAGSGGKHVSIAVLGCTASPYCVAWSDAAVKAAAGDNASATPFDVVLDPNKELAACQDAISSKKFQAMVIGSLIPTAGVACARAAKAAGLPLVSTFGPIGSNTAGAEPTVAGVTSQVITPLDEQLKDLVDDILVPACAKRNPCNVGWLRTTQSLPQSDALIAKYLQQALKANPNIKIVGEASTELDTAPAITATTSFLQKTPNLSVILSYASQGTFGAAKALKAAGKKPGKDVLLVTSGGSKAVIDLMRAGEVYGTTINLPVTEMTKSVQLAAAAARGEKVPSAVNPLTIGRMPVVITQQNLAKFPQFTGQYSQ